MGYYYTFAFMITTADALTQVFSTRKKALTPLLRKWKSRHKKGKLTTQKQEAILKRFGYRKAQDTLWTKK